MISQKNKIYILWGLFCLTVLIPIAEIAGAVFPLINTIKYILPIVTLVLHAYWFLGLKRSLLLLLPPYFIGLLFEIIGVNFGVIFGGHYFYNPDTLGPLYLGVPILIPFFWSFFVYTGYMISTSFINWLNIDKPDKSNQKIWRLLLLILLDGLFVVAIDLFMDPIMVAMHNWTWLDSGFYYGIPFGNFFGWFLVAVISTGIFRVYEYHCPSEKIIPAKTLYLIPVVGYGLLSFLFLMLALNLKLNNLAIFGVLIMLPVTILNLLLYATSKRN